MTSSIEFVRIFQGFDVGAPTLLSLELHHSDVIHCDRLIHLKEYMNPVSLLKESRSQIKGITAIISPRFGRNEATSCEY